MDKEEIKRYLKENLKVEVSIWCRSVEVTLRIEDEIINTDSTSLPD